MSRRVTEDSSIPTSSMADIAFLLIIFFMVTSVFSATKGLEFALPADDDDPRDPRPEEAVFIHVGSDRLVVDCREMDLDGILAYLEPKLLRDPNKPVILFTDPDAEYQDMVRVYDVLVGAGDADEGSGFRVRHIAVPTRRDLDDYVAAFGENPFDLACR